MVAIDDDACTLYDQVGLHSDLGPDHPVFAWPSGPCWTEAAPDGNAFLAGAARHRRPSACWVSSSWGASTAAPTLDQLSVRMTAMRQGTRPPAADARHRMGRRESLLADHVRAPSLERPFYERHSFVVVPQSARPPGSSRIWRSSDAGCRLQSTVSRCAAREGPRRPAPQEVTPSSPATAREP